MRILEISNPDYLTRILREIEVDPYGIKIMLPKGITHLVRVNSLSNIAANILKQEMLSLGAEVAVSRGSLTGRTKKTDCLMMGTLCQLNRLQEKLRLQPFGLNQLAQDLNLSLRNYQKDDFLLNLGRYKLNLSMRTHLMAILNLTPDSFSGDGLYSSSLKLQASDVNEIVAVAEKLVRDGADIIDVGGESSRPGAKPVTPKEEIKRTLPAVRAIAKKIKIPVSIDTSKPEVAKAAMDNGAVMINDITGLRNKRMLKCAQKYKAAVVIMHMQGTPRTMQKNPRYHSLIDETIQYLVRAIARARENGISEDKIVIDPGIGFAKTLKHNLEILNRLKEFKCLGRPILLGASRKSFIGKILKTGCNERLAGTIAASVIAAKNGAKILRVHDVLPLKQALAVTDAIGKI